MKMLSTASSLLKRLGLSAFPVACFLLTAPVLRAADEAETPVWHDPVVVEREGGGLELLTPEKAEERRKKQREAEAAAEAAKKKPDPGWIGDCYYYADGGYYHKDGVYWKPDLKTHYVYAEECWHLANDGILTGTGVYYPPMAAPDGYFGVPWRLAAVMTALIAGPPRNPGNPPARPTQVITEVRSSSDR